MRLSSHVQTHHKTLIIAAIASRPYVEAAVAAGYDVVAIDCFIDVDTQRLAISSYRIGLNDGRLDGDQLLAILASLDVSNVEGFCYGAGFEQQPMLIAAIAKQVKVFGNSASVVAHCANPVKLFNDCDALDIAYPSITLDKPQQATGWLQKLVGGSGGGHIKPVLLTSAHDATVYYQQYIPGRAMSCLFLADGDAIQVIGFNDLWQDATDTMRPFRYSGAASQAAVDAEVEKGFVDVVRLLARKLKLMGLNSCDAIVQDGNIFVLEVNARLSATLDLYPEAKGALMAAHITATRAVLPASIGSVAHQVVYAMQDILIKADITWPSWVKDIPQVGEIVVDGMPVCTVMAEAGSPAAAKALVDNRVAELMQAF